MRWTTSTATKSCKGNTKAPREEMSRRGGGRESASRTTTKSLKSDKRSTCLEKKIFFLETPTKTKKGKIEFHQKKLRQLRDCDKKYVRTRTAECIVSPVVCWCDFEVGFRLRQKAYTHTHFFYWLRRPTAPASKQKPKRHTHQWMFMGLNRFCERRTQFWPEENRFFAGEPNHKRWLDATQTHALNKLKANKIISLSIVIKSLEHLLLAGTGCCRSQNSETERQRPCTLRHLYATQYIVNFMLMLKDVRNAMQICGRLLIFGSSPKISRTSKFQETLSHCVCVYHFI